MQVLVVVFHEGTQGKQVFFATSHHPLRSGRNDSRELITYKTVASFHVELMAIAEARPQGNAKPIGRRLALLQTTIGLYVGKIERGVKQVAHLKIATAVLARRDFNNAIGPIDTIGGERGRVAGYPNVLNVVYIELSKQRQVGTLTIDNDHSIRSEEHTSELQSRQYHVCRLLLEKTKMSCFSNYC